VLVAFSHAQNAEIMQAKVDITYAFAILRGSISGLDKGFFRRTNYILDANCFGENSVNDAM